MSRYDTELPPNKELVVINWDQCKKMTELINSLESSRKSLPIPRKEVLAHSLSEDELKNLYFSVVAICHQTTPHAGRRLEGFVDGKHRVGWDYLLTRWIRAAEHDPSLVTPS